LALSSNSNAIHLLFNLDYETMKQNCKEFACQLAQKVFHPERLNRISIKYDIEFDEYLDLI
jgi:hypothetical protein